MEHSTILCVVDVHTVILVLDTLFKAYLASKVCQQLKGLRSDQVFGKIKMQVACIKTHPLYPLRILRKPLPQADPLLLELVEMLLELRPCLGACCVYWRIDSHLASPFLFSVTLITRYGLQFTYSIL